jgi:hypothetical protein
MNSKINLQTLSIAAAGAACLSFMTGGAAQAVQIGASSFRSGAVVESFEGLSPGSNVGLFWNGYGYLIPGVNTPFTFASGATLVNTNQSTIVGDWSIGYSGFGLNNNGLVNNSNVPDATAYLGFNSNSSQGSIEFTFASDLLRVGGFVTGAKASYPGNNIISLSAFDGSGNLLETVTKSGVDVSNWASNFLGLQNTGGIRKITFTGDYTVLDKLTFETAASQPVPEPASILGLLTLGGLGAKAKLKRKNQQSTEC